MGGAPTAGRRSKLLIAQAKNQPVSAIRAKAYRHNITLHVNRLHFIGATRAVGGAVEKSSPLLAIAGGRPVAERLNLRSE